MINPVQIPDEVVEAAADALMAMPDGFPQDADPDEYARAAIAAGLAAWLGKQYRAWDDVMGTGLYAILPLTEARDGE
jgi:hypothetical protein